MSTITEEVRDVDRRVWLAGWGHQVALAADGSSALALADAFQPECAIVDLSIARDERDGTGASSPPAVSSGAAAA